MISWFMKFYCQTCLSVDRRELWIAQGKTKQSRHVLAEHCTIWRPGSRLCWSGSESREPKMIWSNSLQSKVQILNFGSCHSGASGSRDCLGLFFRRSSSASDGVWKCWMSGALDDLSFRCFFDMFSSDVSFRCFPSTDTLRTVQPFDEKDASLQKQIEQKARKIYLYCAIHWYC